MKRLCWRGSSHLDSYASMPISAVQPHMAAARSKWRSGQFTTAIGLRGQAKPRGARVHKGNAVGRTARRSHPHQCRGEWVDRNGRRQSSPAASDHGDYGLSAARLSSTTTRVAVQRVIPAAAPAASLFCFLQRVGACNARRPLRLHRAAYHRPLFRTYEIAGQSLSIFYASMPILEVHTDDPREGARRCFPS
jgi:hypothetical protein